MGKMAVYHGSYMPVKEPRVNDLFFTCSLIEYLGRKTKNRRGIIVNALGKKEISRIYELADIYHSDNIETVSDDFIEKCHIAQGSYDNVSACLYSIPSYWDIGKVYKRLILGVDVYSVHPHMSRNKACAFA